MCMDDVHECPCMKANSSLGDSALLIRPVQTKQGLGLGMTIYKTMGQEQKKKRMISGINKQDAIAYSPPRLDWI